MIEGRKLTIKWIKLWRDKSPEKKPNDQKIFEKMFSLLVILEMQIEAIMGLPFQPPSDGRKVWIGQWQVLGMWNKRTLSAPTGRNENNGCAQICDSAVLVFILCPRKRHRDVPWSPFVITVKKKQPKHQSVVEWII